MSSGGYNGGTLGDAVMEISPDGNSWYPMDTKVPGKFPDPVIITILISTKPVLCLILLGRRYAPCQVAIDEDSFFIGKYFKKRTSTKTT